MPALMLGRGPDDPFGPVDQDPDDVRRTVCELVNPDASCAPTDTTPIEPGDGGGSSAFASLAELLLWALFIGLVAFVVVMAVRLVLATRGSGGRRRRRRGDGEDADDDVEELPRVVVDRTREPRDWRQEAEDHRRAGRFRDALRCRYRALVGDLARRGLVDEIPGRTTGEERAQMSVAAPATAPAFTAAADLFDGAWYGDVPVADADVARMEALERDVLAGAAR